MIIPATFSRSTESLETDPLATRGCVCVRHPGQVSRLMLQISGGLGHPSGARLHPHRAASCPGASLAQRLPCLRRMGDEQAAALWPCPLHSPAALIVLARHMQHWSAKSWYELEDLMQSQLSMASLAGHFPSVAGAGPRLKRDEDGSGKKLVDWHSWQEFEAQTQWHAVQVGS